MSLPCWDLEPPTPAELQALADLKEMIKDVDRSWIWEQKESFDGNPGYWNLSSGPGTGFSSWDGIGLTEAADHNPKIAYILCFAYSLRHAWKIEQKKAVRP